MLFIDILDNLGFFGPFILIGYSIIVLWSNIIYFKIYITLIIINICLSHFIKFLLKEPRPNDEGIMINRFEIVSGIEEYGMPSGHAQLSVFTTIFLFKIINSLNILIGCAVVCYFIFYQRYVKKRHSINQIFVGGLIGAIIALGSHNIISNNLIYK